MQNAKWILAAAVAMIASACQGIPDDMSLAEYCSDGQHAATDVCKINVEIDGQKSALASTNMTVSEARALAASAASRADDAMLTANAAMNREDEIYCETRTLNKTNEGTCSPGYKLVSCNQTRYTYRAGGLSFIREIDDTHCRFNERVLEVQVRCCMAGAAPKPLEQPISKPTVSKPEELSAS